MEAQKVVPDVLDKVPDNVAIVKYGSGVELNMGNELTPLQVKDTPIKVTWPAEANVLYTLLYTDPDAPSRDIPTMREILHWLVVNIPGTNLSKGTTVVEYAGSGAPQGTGLHRYVLTVYKQTDSLPVEQFAKFQNPLARFKFNTRDFTAKHKLGAPIAGNFYQAQTDDFIRKRYADQLEAALKKHELIPDILDASPEQSLTVLYPSNAFQRFGNELTPTSVKDIPNLISWKAEPNTLYTFIFTDACSRANFDTHAEILHWLVVNIPGTDVSKGETYTGYVGSGPPKEVGLHRYVMLVYEQQGPLTLDQPKVSSTSVDGRRHFNTRKFVAANKLGKLVAGNFYLAKYDEYVDVLRAQLGY